MVNKEKIACFTGHRPDKLGGYNETNPTALKVKEQLRGLISKAKAEGITTFISGMALGIDQWAAEIVLEDPELTLIAAIPCPGQDAKWPWRSKKKYMELLAKTHKVEIISQQYAPYVMQKRNEWMVDNSGLMISVWNGTDGGTANCVRYGEKKSIKRINYNPDTDTID